MKKTKIYHTPLLRCIALTTTTLLNGSIQQEDTKKFKNVSQDSDQNLPTFNEQWGDAGEAS